MHFQKPMLGVPLDWSNPLNKGCVMHIGMQEGHGDVVRDLSMYGNHGTLNNFAFPPTAASGWNPGRTGVGLNFDASDDYVVCDNDASLNMVDAITVSLWTRRAGDASGVYGYLIQKGGNNQWTIFQNQAGSNLSFNIKVGGAVASDLIAFDFADGQWHHIICSYISGSKQMWVDGNKKDDGPDTGVISTTANELFVGGNGVDNTRSFNGPIDQVRIHNRALTAKEVKDYYINPWQVYLDK